MSLFIPECAIKIIFIFEPIQRTEKNGQIIDQSVQYLRNYHDKSITLYIILYILSINFVNGNYMIDILYGGWLVYRTSTNHAKVAYRIVSSMNYVSPLLLAAFIGDRYSRLYRIQ